MNSFYVSVVAAFREECGCRLQTYSLETTLKLNNYKIDSNNNLYIKPLQPNMQTRGRYESLRKANRHFLK